MSEYENKQKEYDNLLPLKTVKESIIALSSDEEEMKKLLNLNLQNGMDFTDLILSAMQEIHGTGSKFIENVSKILNMTGRILPVTLDKMKVCAELEDRYCNRRKRKYSYDINRKSVKNK